MRSRSSVLTRSPAVILGLLRAADIVVIAVAGLIAYELRHEEIRLPENYVLAVAACCLITRQRNPVVAPRKKVR